MGSQSFELKANKELLQAATRRNNVEEIVALLNSGIDINYQDCCGFTALHIASIHGYHDNIRILLEYDADPNICNNDVRIPLHFAAGTGLGYYSIVKILLEHGADPNAVDKWNQTPLLLTGYSNIHIISELLKYDADPNIQNIDGDTPLYHAACRGRKEAVEMLLNKGALPNLICEKGLTALHRAAFGCFPVIVGLLLKFNADSTIKNERGETPLDLVKKKLLRYNEQDYPDLNSRCIKVVELLENQ